jgi:hypothetical protein
MYSFFIFFKLIIFLKLLGVIVFFSIFHICILHSKYYPPGPQNDLFDQPPLPHHLVGIENNHAGFVLQLFDAGTNFVVNTVSHFDSPDTISVFHQELIHVTTSVFVGELFFISVTYVLQLSVVTAVEDTSNVFSFSSVTISIFAVIHESIVLLKSLLSKTILIS